VGSLPMPMQAKLLRTLQERVIDRVGGHKPIPVDVRIIAATNIDLQEAVKQNKFREDLFYRLNVIPLHIPPLKKRIDDLPLLINNFLNKYNKEFGKKVKGFSPEAMELLKAYSWPGNVRELENLIERLVVLGKKGLIQAERLPREISGTDAGVVKVGFEEVPLKEAEKKFEAEFIRKAIEKAGGSKGKAAKLLGIHRNTLLKLEKKFGKNIHPSH